MSTGLTLLPNRWRSFDRAVLAHTRIDLDEDYDLWEEVKKVRMWDLPHHGIEWYGDDGLVTYRDDAYGEPLKYAFAKDLAAIDLPEGVSPWNRGVWALLKELGPDMTIILYWC